MLFRPIYTIKVALRFIANAYVVFVLPVRDALFAPLQGAAFYRYTAGAMRLSWRAASSHV